MQAPRDHPVTPWLDLMHHIILNSIRLTISQNTDQYPRLSISLITGQYPRLSQDNPSSNLMHQNRRNPVLENLLPDHQVGVNSLKTDSMSPLGTQDQGVKLLPHPLYHNHHSKEVTRLAWGINPWFECVQRELYSFPDFSGTIFLINKNILTSIFPPCIMKLNSLYDTSECYLINRLFQPTCYK